MFRGWLIAAATLCWCASVVLARPGIVKTKDGQTLEGDITEKQDTVTVIAKGGIETTVDRTNIGTITYPGGLDDQFQERLAKLDARDAKGRLELARWAFDNRRYDLARDACEQALSIDPNYREAADFLATVQRQIRLENRPAVPITPPVRAAPTTAEGRATDRRFLSPADINLIRQMELKATDTNVRIHFNNDVKRKFVAAYNQDSAAFNSLRPFDQAMAILAKADARLRADVEIMDDPASLREYRSVMQRTILAGCATSTCHGGTSAGNLVLYNTAPDPDALTYTNFYILSKYTKNVPGTGSGIFGSGLITHRLIDRTHPEQSLLAQYGLPLSAAQLDHPPDVPGFRATFTGKNDARYRQLITWMGTALVPVEPNYGIQFDVPTGTAATRPSTGPTTHPGR